MKIVAGKIGTIDFYTYGESGLSVAVEYVKPNKDGKKSDIYFAFDNPKLKMITGGEWQISLYPHCPCKFKQNEILFVYYIIFEGDILQCEIIHHEDLFFTFIHKKTTEIKNESETIIYTLEFSPKPNYRRKITIPTSDIERKIVWFFKNDKVFYQSNEIGNIVMNYLEQCKN